MNTSKNTYHARPLNASVVIEQKNERYTQFLEVSATIDTDTKKLETEFRNGRKIKFSYRLMRSLSDNLANWQGEDNAIRYFGKTAIDSAKRRIKSDFKKTLAIIDSAKNHPAWDAMDTIATDNIKHYKADFYYHDALQLAKNANRAFLWIVRETGTRIMFSNSEWNRETLNYDMKNNADSLVYFWSGYNLESVDFHRACILLSRMPTQD